MKTSYNASFYEERAKHFDNPQEKFGFQCKDSILYLESHRVIDLLPDRTVATSTAWFKALPALEVISRDRGTEYALAAKLGAPQAIQVADRWHLVQNLANALQVLLARYRPEIRLSRNDAEANVIETLSYAWCPFPHPRDAQRDIRPMK